MRNDAVLKINPVRNSRPVKNEISDLAGRSGIISDGIKRLFPKCLSGKLPARIMIVPIDEKTSRRLNLIYRGKKKPASVLSFRYGPDYGEILVTRDIVKKEARKCGADLEYQMTRMIIHGMLHLAETHHEESRSADRAFVKLEKEIINKLLDR